MTERDRVLVVLMTYGSPSTLDDIPGYLRNIRGGREPDDSLVAEFRRRYRLIGGSPLLRITGEQAAGLEKELNGAGGGRVYRVVPAMRFSAPLISDVVKAEAPQSRQMVGVIMSPQYSPIIMGGYIRTLKDAASSLGPVGPSVKIAEDWHLQPCFLEALAERVREALSRMAPEARESTLVLFTAHSMPRRVVEKEPGYLSQLTDTAAAVAGLVGLPADRWRFCYQSAGHTQEEWLKPDFADVMPELRRAGYASVLVAPVQFLADHLEVLYDIEIAAREQAERAGIAFNRIESLNTSPLLIRALAATVRDVLAQPR